MPSTRHTQATAKGPTLSEQVILQRDDPANLAEGEYDDDQVDLSPAGMWLAVAGAVAMLVAVFLPYAESHDFAFIEQNTLIQTGDGWLFVGLAVGSAAALYRMYRGRRRNWGPIVTGAIAAAVALFYGANGADALQLCSTDPATFGQSCVQASPGIGIYLAGLGGLLMVVGGWQIRNSPQRGWVDGESSAPALDGTKTCPDCAETVLAQARVCKHCGFRFGAIEEGQ
jgi:Uncharacterised protein family UPF0547